MKESNKMANNQSQCKECGCKCSKRTASDHDVHLHIEIENLKQKLLERDSHIATMETNFLNEASKFPNGEFVALQEELLTWQDKYKRLYEAHRRIQRVNQGLEDKLLRLVDVCETEKTVLTKDVATLSHKLADANYAIKKLTADNERYKNDVALAIQFLQCKQGNFVSQKLDSLPNEVQAKVSSYVSAKRVAPKPDDRKPSPPEIKSIKVPIPTFPPTAMVYSVPKSAQDQLVGLEEDDPESSQQADIVSAAIMAKVLEERERERACAKHCDTCTCSKTLKIVHETSHHCIGTQTGDWGSGEASNGRSSVGNVPSWNVDNVLLQAEHHPTIAQIKQAQQIVKVETNGETQVIKEHTQNVENETTTFISNISGNIPTQNVNNVGHNQSITQIQNTQHILDVETNEETQIVNGSTNNSVKSEPEINGNCNKSDSTYQLSNISSPVASENSKAVKFDSSSLHHRLCDRSSSTFQIDLDDDSNKLESANNNGNPDPLKGPRYCSVRVQSGSKNILLDNVHNNIAPVLYTHPSEKKTKSVSQIKTKGSCTESCSSEDRKSINLLTNSLQNQQRVAEWVQNTHNSLENDSDTSRSDSLKKCDCCHVDPAKYAEMENNVKKFLFGDSQNEFLKRVAIGKQNYQNLRENGNNGEDKNESLTRSSSSHTETDI